MKLIRMEMELTKFCTKAENEYVTYFYKEVVKRTPGLEDTFCGHPLVKHAIGTEV